MQAIILAGGLGMSCLLRQSSWYFICLIINKAKLFSQLHRQKTWNMQSTEREFKGQEYGLGCIIKRKVSLFADQCGVIIGWDSWLRPLVLAITQKSRGAAVHFSILTLDEFEAGSGSQVVFAAGELDPQYWRGDLTDRLWSRAQGLLKAGLSSCNLANPDCEDIARFVVMGYAPAHHYLRQGGQAQELTFVGQRQTISEREHT